MNKFRSTIAAFRNTAGKFNQKVSTKAKLIACLIVVVIGAFCWFFPALATIAVVAIVAALFFAFFYPEDTVKLVGDMLERKNNVSVRVPEFVKFHMIKVRRCWAELKELLTSKPKPKP